MDGLAKLAEEHEHIRELASALAQADAAGDSETARQLTQQITAEMNTIAAVEHEVVFPAVRDLTPQLAPQVDEVMEEHVIAKELLFEAATSESVARLDAPPDVALVTEAVEHMAADEKLLAAVRDATDPEGLAGISHAVEEMTAIHQIAGAEGRNLKEHEAGTYERDEGASTGADPAAKDPAIRVRNQ
jgi:hypothetical protein